MLMFCRAILESIIRYEITAWVWQQDGAETQALPACTNGYEGNGVRWGGAMMPFSLYEQAVRKGAAKKKKKCLRAPNVPFSLNTEKTLRAKGQKIKKRSEPSLFQPLWTC